MAKEFNLTAQQIYDKEFHVDVRGFATDEVDEFLDQVIEDYQLYDERIEELGSAITRYEAKIKELQQTIQKLQENAGASSTPSAQYDQVDVLKRIAKLEAAVFGTNE